MGPVDPVRMNFTVGELPRSGDMSAIPELDPPVRGEVGEWGVLPPYLLSLQRKGTEPVIPERYRKLFEAYVKRRATSSRTPTGSRR